MPDISEARFCLVGRFLSFQSGEKSPYQKISLAAVLSGETGSSLFAQALSTDELETQQIFLGKDLRRSLYRYLVPQDWIRVIGQQVLNRRSGQMEWQAAEISKLSSSQVDELKRRAVLSDAVATTNANTTKTNTTKPVRLLICQASDCRQRGSFTASKAIAQAITQADCSARIVVQSTGCMKRCKVGPNVVMLPGGCHSQVTPELGVSLIQTLSVE